MSVAAQARGGGLYIQGSGCTVTADVSANAATVSVISLINVGAQARGGGIYASGQGLTVTGDVSGNGLGMFGSLSFSAGGGIYLGGASEATISGAVSENHINTTISIADQASGNGIAVVDSQGVILDGIVVRDNDFTGFGGDPEQIRLESTTAGSLGNLVINQCSIGGPIGAGIVETGGEGYADVSGHAITNNAFYGLDSLYRNSDGAVVDADAAGLEVLNTPSHASHDAATASGNTMEAE
jgi:hypothetical protein